MSSDSLKKLLKISRIELALVIVLAVFRAASMFFYLDETVLFSLGKYSVANFGAFVLHLVSAFIFLYMVVILMNQGLSWYSNYRNKNKTTYKFIPDSKKYFWFNCAFLFIGWLPHFIIRYPGAACIDTWVMFEEYFGYGFSELHSVFYTVLLGKLLVLFNKMGVLNLGMYVFVLIHFLVYIAAFAYMFTILRKLKMPPAFIVVTRIFCLFNPLIIGYIGVAVKDSLYSALFVAAMLLVVDIYTDKDKATPLYKYVLLILAIVFACLTRKNGVYVFGPFIVLYFLIKKNTKQLLKYAGIAAFVLYFIALSTLRFIYMPAPSPTEEMLSIPFQQTARYVRDHSDDITDEEKEVIDTVFGYDTLADRYNPRYSDPVKNKSDISGNMGPYLKVWGAQFVRHPMCYVAATMEQNYYFFVPETADENTAFFVNSHSSYEYDHHNEVTAYPQWFASPKALLNVQEWSYRFYMSMYKIPVLEMLWNTSIGTYLVLFISVKLLKRKEDIVLMVPFLMTLFCIFIAPAFQGHPRFMMPIMYFIPVMVAYLLYRKSTDSHSKDQPCSP